MANPVNLSPEGRVRAVGAGPRLTAVSKQRGHSGNRWLGHRRCHKLVTLMTFKRMC
jgi:hypothetical protein